MKLNILWNKNDKIALALSGGVDSVALFHLLVTEYKNSYKELVVFHINHGLRIESEEEEDFVRKLATQYGVKLYVERLNLNERTRDSHISEEMYARTLRYEAFSKFAELENINIVLTAHHKNDNIENILIRLLTGRGTLYTLTIEEKVTINNLTVVRPLINILKEELQNYATLHNIKYYDDISNYNTEDYTRNYVRHKIVPLLTDVNKSSYNNLINFAKHYQELSSSVKENALEKLEQANIKINNNRVTFEASYFYNLTDEEKYYFLIEIINKHIGNYNISRNSLSDAIACINEFSGNVSFDIKKDLKIIKEYQSISICKIEKKCYNDKIEITEEDINTKFICNFINQTLTISEDNTHAEIAFNKSDLPILITTKSSGDKIKRGDIYKKLSRFFIDEKVPKSLRDELAVVKNKDGEVLGVLGVGLKVSKNKNYDYYIKSNERKN